MILVPYDPAWPGLFESLETELLKALSCAVAIEHVGSTAIPGMWAKPVIDLDAVIPDEAVFETAKRELEAVGYVHQGDKGIQGREAFRRAAAGDGILDSIPHHLYVCTVSSDELKRHKVFRDRLRNSPELVAQYNAIKLEILRRVGDDNRVGYVEAKEGYRWFFDSVIGRSDDERRSCNRF